MIVGSVKDRKEALPLVEAILREQPDHTGANFAMGSILLEQKNAAGIQYLEKAMQLERATTGDASLLLSGFYFDEGNKELAEEFRKRAEEHFEREQKQQEQALRFTENDHFIPHGLDENAIKEIQTQLTKVRGLERAYLVRKVIDGSDASIYVLGVLAGFTWRDGQNAKHLDPLFEELANIPGLPSPMVFLSLEGQYAGLLHKVDEIDGALLFTTAGAGVTYVQ